MFTKENTDNLPILESSSCPPIDPLSITVNGIASLLSGLDVHKACGPDGIYPRLLKETAPNVAPMLTVLYQASLKQHKVPLDWKKVLVASVFKKGNRTSPSNFASPAKFLNMLFTATYLNISRPITYFVATSMVSENTHVIVNSSPQ